MELEVIKVIYNVTNLYTIFDNEESTLYHENNKFIIYTKKEKLLANFSSESVSDEGITLNFDNTELNNPIDYKDILDKWNFIMDISSIKKMHFEGNENKYTSVYSYLFRCYFAINPLPPRYRISDLYLAKISKVFRKAKRELNRFIQDIIE